MQERKPLPKRRQSENFKKHVPGSQNAIYVTVGRYEDSSVGEVFIDVAKEGTELRLLMNAFAMMTSLALQYGAPMERIVTFLNAFPDTGIPKLVGEVLVEATKQETNSNEMG